MSPAIRAQDIQDSELQGESCGSGLSLIFIDAEPGRGPKLHRHAYEEVFVVHDGSVTFTLAAETLEAGAGDVVIAPAGTPHAWLNQSDGRVRMTAIHHAPAFVTEWLAP